MLFVNIYHVHFYVLKGIAFMHWVLYIRGKSRDYCELLRAKGTCLNQEIDLDN